MGQGSIAASVVISDLHMSCGALDDFDAELEHELVRFLGTLGPAVELIINGDFLDFVQAAPIGGVELESTSPDGVPLCFTENQSREKLASIADAHQRTFAALRRFLQQPSTQLVILPGNHDPDFFWTGVQDDVRALLGPGVSREQVIFCLEPSFRASANARVWIEHGHQHDAVNRFWIADRAAWSAGHPPIREDRHGVRRLYECTGTRFLIKYLNHLDADYPCVDNVKPFSKFLRMFGASAFVPGFGPLKAALATCAMLRFLGVTAASRPSDLLGLDAARVPAPADRVRRLLARSTERHRAAVKTRLDEAGFDTLGRDLDLLLAAPRDAESVLDVLAEHPEILDAIPLHEAELLSDSWNPGTLALTRGFRADESGDLISAARHGRGGRRRRGRGDGPHARTARGSGSMSVLQHRIVDALFRRQWQPYARVDVASAATEHVPVSPVRRDHSTRRRGRTRARGRVRGSVVVDEFRITVVVQDERTLKVRWAHKAQGAQRLLSFLPYCIDFGVVRRRAGNVRDKLGALVQQCMDSDNGGVARSAPELRALAQAGRELYDALFLEADDDCRDQVAAVQEHFQSHPDSTITVSVDPRVHIPWGLVWDGPLPSADQDALSADAYQDFWAHKHRVTAVYSRITEDRVRRPLPLSASSLLPVVNRPVFDSAQSMLDVEQQSHSAEIFSRFAPIYGAEDYRQQWTANAGAIGLLFFYCHANGTQLAFDNDRIDCDQLRLSFKRAQIGKRDWSCVLFLSGCSTAIGDPSGAFLEATAEEGIGGFIGTETEVPDLFALRFGVEFLRLFLAGMPVADAIALMRRRHFPLSLIYTVYTYPMIRVAPQENVPLPAPVDANFSFQPLGTRRL